MWISPWRALATVGLLARRDGVRALARARERVRDIRLVDPAHPVDSVIRVPGEKPGGGGPGAIYFVDVRERPACLLERLLPRTRADGSDLVSVPPISRSTLERRL